MTATHQERDGSSPGWEEVDKAFEQKEGDHQMSNNYEDYSVSNNLERRRA